MNRQLTRKLTLWLTGALAVLVLAACGQTPVDPGPAGDTSTLAVTVNGNGSVTGDAGGLACTSAGGETCAASVDDGTQVTLTATPDEGETFNGWGGACSGTEATCAVTVNGDTNVVANFSGAPVGDANTFLIANPEDDGEELDDGSFGNATFPAGHNYTDSSDLDLAFDPSHQSTQHVGLRFSEVTIPQGAEIESAHITFTGAEQGTAGPVTITIAGQDSVNPAPFVDDPNGEGNSDLSDRPTTEASVDWEVTEAWSSGMSVDSADITTIVQEIVNSPDWLAGNAMAFVLTGNSATEFRTAQSANIGTAPVLHVEFASDAGDGGGDGTGDGGAGDGTGDGGTTE